MEKAKVYFTDFRTHLDVSQGMTLQKLCRRAGIGDIDFEGKFVAIKMHFGELGNFSYIRPNYVKAVADLIKELGGKPFLTDANTLYPGSRKNAVDHLYNAEVNGFNSVTTGCYVIIADGLKGTDEAEVPVPNGEYCKKALIGRALYDADIIISLSHFKGHEEAGFGGALKNIGMGCGSRAGKMEQHCDGKPSVKQSLCVGCGSCYRICAHEAPVIKNGKATIDHSKCVGCGRCLAVCPKDAIHQKNYVSGKMLNYKIAEYSYAVVKDRPCFHISLICDVSPNCDCHSENDIPIIPDVGMLASFDPVALDQACADLANAQEAIAGSQLDDAVKEGHHHEDHEGHDHFYMVHPNTDWRDCLAHAEEIGIGTRQYELVEI